MAQGRHRVWFERDVMLWYAAGLAIDANGDIITKFHERQLKGRKSVYRAFGLGQDTYMPLLVRL